MRRFEGLPVNVSYSSILFPAEVNLEGEFFINLKYIKSYITSKSLADPEVQSAIRWSSHLDPLFANNLERDAALSWQYFGSSTGFLRRFPGTAWPPEGSRGSKEIHDFRNEDWFIQAASSPKDIVSLLSRLPLKILIKITLQQIILLDSSGSMSGKQFELAKTTAYAILDTLGDDDYVNLITFSDVVKSVVPCFKEKMVSFCEKPKKINDFRMKLDSFKFPCFSQKVYKNFHSLPSLRNRIVVHRITLDWSSFQSPFQCFL
jgi:hypothetical protein